MHDATCCGESAVASAEPVPRIICDSTASVAEKAQQEPHCPWFLIGVTASVYRQLIDFGLLRAARSHSITGAVGTKSFGFLSPFLYFSDS